MRKNILSLGGAGVVLAGCILYILTSVLQVPLSGATTVTVDMPVTGGLFTGSQATYRGIVVGKVTNVALTSTGVAATVRLQPGSDIPRDSTARVRSLSPIGEQFLDFEPATTTGPYLRSGDVLTASANDLPTTVADLSISMDKLMGEIDPTKVQTVLNELNTGLSGAEDDLQRLTLNGMNLVTSADANVGTLSALLRDGNTLLSLGADESTTISALTRSYATFAEWLRSYQPQLYAMLAKAPGQIDRMRHLIQAMEADWPSFLAAQGDVADILNTRNQALRALLQYFPAGLEAFSSAIRDGRLQLDIIARRGPHCMYTTAPRAPQDGSYRALQKDGHCSTSLKTYSQRGAEFVPTP